ncbi:MAG: hypothetical protein ACO390_06895 [bacterium]
MNPRIRRSVLSAMKCFSPPKLPAPALPASMKVVVALRPAMS